MTTTAHSLHPEDENRMLSYQVQESPERIREALLAQALGLEENSEPLNQEPWFALYRYIKAGSRNVYIPFASEIVRRLPLTHDRVKRDFPQILALIKASALLHSLTREESEDGTVVASLRDYENVRELVDEPLSQGLEQAVPEVIRSVVQTVEELKAANQKAEHLDGFSLTEIAEKIGRDRSVVSRNVQKAIGQGYLINKNPGRGREASVVPGKRKLPNASVLPLPNELIRPETDGQSEAEAEEAVSSGALEDPASRERIPTHNWRTDGQQGKAPWD